MILRDNKGRFKKGSSHPPERKEVDIEYCKKKYLEGYSCFDISKKFEVSPETIGNRLKKLGLEFYTHQYMKIEHGYQCDILIPKQKGIERPTIIECFGDYWHKIPYGNPIDSIRCQELREKGFRVLVFWENEIKVMKLNDLRRKIEL